jgi:hypothetical protein
VLNGVILALALFFAGIAPRFQWVWVRATISGIGLLVLIYALYILVTAPVK